MPILNRAHEMQPEIAAWRRHLHENPELDFAVHETAAFVADKLRAFGCDEVVEGIGRTGVVGIITGRHGDGATIGLRADMDALPLTEITGLPHASKRPGKMHACGHDGHTAMLLGAAMHLAETRNFAGRVAVIFQPAEEGGGGGREMVSDGMMERFGISEVYGMHNEPGLPLGRFATRPGGIMGSTDEFTVTVKGRGGHAAFPHQTVDPILVASHVVVALQQIASRNADPVDSVAVTVTTINAGEALNIIPETATLTATIRCLSKEMRVLAVRRFREIAEGMALAFGASADVVHREGYPVTVNHPRQTEFSAACAAAVAGEANVDAAYTPMLGAEDFSYMLEARPGSFIFIGNGDTAGLHHPAYDFDDAAIPYGVSYWVELAERSLAPKS